MADVNYTPGKFVWHELLTPDVAKSRGFYTELLGWSFQQVPMGDFTYDMIHRGDTPIGGMMVLDPVQMKGVPPHWMGYVSVPDVDECASAVTSAGGKLVVEPRDIPAGGRFCAMVDPQGAAVSALKATTGDPPEVEGMNHPTGSFCWDTLATNDVDGAAAFYKRVFGWDRVPFEGAENNWVFTSGPEKWAASLMPALEGVPSHFMTYLLVDELEGARAKAKELGAQIVVDEIPVPGIGTFAIIQDNVGAAVALFEGNE